MATYATFSAPQPGLVHNLNLHPTHPLLQAFIVANHPVLLCPTTPGATQLAFAEVPMKLVRSLPHFAPGQAHAPQPLCVPSIGGMLSAQTTLLWVIRLPLGVVNAALIVLLRIIDAAI